MDIHFSLMGKLFNVFKLIVFCRIDGDAVSALSNGDSLQISEVMDRLSRMEDLLTTIIQRFNLLCIYSILMSL